MGLDVLDDAMELVERLGGLGVQKDVAREVEALGLIESLNDDGLAVRLPDQAQHLGMALLAEDDDLRGERREVRGERMLSLDALLELEHHGAGGIDDFDIVLAGQLIGLGGLTMGA